MYVHALTKLAVHLDKERNHVICLHFLSLEARALKLQLAIAEKNK